MNSGSFDRFDLISIVIGGIMIVVLLVAIGGGLGFAEPRGESTYTGVVVDFENERGIPFETTQAHLKTNPESSNKETFCVHPENRDRQVEVLRDAARSGDVVSVTYSRPLFVPVWDCEADTSIIRDIAVREDVSPEEAASA